jgi:hypothetical protein
MNLRRFLLSAAAAIVIALPPLAAPRAAVTATPVFAQTPKVYQAQIQNAQGTSGVTLVTAGSNGTIVKGIVASNTDSSNAYAVQLSVNGYLLCTVNVPLSSGAMTAAPAVALIAPAGCPGLPLDGAGNPFISLQSGASLAINTTTTVTAAKTVAVTAVGADY